MNFYINNKGVVFDENLQTFDETSSIYPVYYQFLVDEKEFLHTDKKLIEVPKQVRNVQLRLALIKSGHSVIAITNYINSLPQSFEKEELLTLWEFSDTMERNNVNLNNMAIKLGFTKEDLDNLFILANTL